MDYVLVRRRDHRDVLVTKAIPGADGCTDHILVTSKMRNTLQPRRRPQGKRPPANLPIAAAAVVNVTASVEIRCYQLRDTVQSTVLAVLGRACRRHQDKFADSDAVKSNPLAERKLPHKVYVDCPTDDNKAAFYRSHYPVRQRLREMKDAWTIHKTEEIKGYADRSEWKNFFSAINLVYHPPTKDTAPLLSVKGGTLLTETIQILQRWAEHFRGVLNRSSTISDDSIARLPQVETNANLDIPLPSHKTIRAVQQLSSGNAYGSDEIPTEIYRHGGPQLMDNVASRRSPPGFQGRHNRAST
ncbi:hypothetical protein SprV_0100102700 [Sparganum proliferum]